MRAETTTTKKTASKIKDAFGVPNIRGNVANVIGTAPLRPVQEMNTSSCQLKMNGQARANTAIGRASKISTAAISNPCPLTSHNRLGKLNKPRTTNITICDNHADAS